MITINIMSDHHAVMKGLGTKEEKEIKKTPKLDS